MRVDGAKNYFLESCEKFSLLLSEILKNLVRLQIPSLDMLGECFLCTSVHKRRYAQKTIMYSKT